MDAANAAISSPLLEDASVKGARGVIINITGGPDLSLVEVSEASAIIQEAAHEDANIIFGAVVDPKMEGQGQDHRHRDRLRSARAAKALSAVGRRRRRSTSSTTRPGARSRPRRSPPLAAAAARMSISRRPVLDLPLMCAARRVGRATAAPGAEFEPVSPLDVPAFLRRQSEG